MLKISLLKVEKSQYPSKELKMKRFSFMIIFSLFSLNTIAADIVCQMKDTRIIINESAKSLEIPSGSQYSGLVTDLSIKGDQYSGAAERGSSFKQITVFVDDEDSSVKIIDLDGRNTGMQDATCE